MYAKVEFNVNELYSGSSRKGKRKSSSKFKIAKHKVKKQKDYSEQGTKFAGIVMLDTVKIINSKVGAYTGNKIRSNATGETLKYASYMLIAASNPYVALGVVALETANNIIDYNIRNINSIQETEYKASYYGRMASSNSRWRGNYK